MIPFEILNSFFHNLGSAAEDSGASGWLPSAIGGAMGSWNSIVGNAVRHKAQQQSQQENQTTNQRVQERGQKLW